MNEWMLFGLLGGLAGPVLGLLELPNVPKERRPNLRDWVYWIPWVLGPLLGVAVVWIYLRSDTALTPSLSIHIGASAPLILRGMASAVPVQRPSVPEGA